MKITDTTKNPEASWLMGGNPDAIVDQEQQGQKELVASSQLPTKVNSPIRGDAKQIYELIGIKVLDSADKLFYDVELPAGWSIKPTDHHMWSHLCDAEGGVRANIFYKAAFYDRDSFINFNRRYSVEQKRVDGAPKSDVTIGWYYYVVDNKTGTNVYQTEVYDGYENKVLEQQAIDWLVKKFPGHADIKTYW